MDDNLGKDVGIDDVADVVVVSRWTQSDEAYDDNRNESMVYCQIVARSLRMVNIHKARSKYGQELDTPVEPGVEAPYQGERKCPQQCLNEERCPRKAMEKHEPIVQATLRVTRTMEAAACFLLWAKLWRNNVVEHLDKPMLRMYNT